MGYGKHGIRFGSRRDVRQYLGKRVGVSGKKDPIWRMLFSVKIKNETGNNFKNRSNQMSKGEGCVKRGGTWTAGIESPSICACDTLVGPGTPWPAAVLAIIVVNSCLDAGCLEPFGTEPFQRSLLPTELSRSSRMPATPANTWVFELLSACNRAKNII